VVVLVDLVDTGTTARRAKRYEHYARPPAGRTSARRRLRDATCDRRSPNSRTPCPPSWWAIVGGQMVANHAAVAGVEPARTTDDAEIVVAGAHERGAMPPL
jgi:hypothetical protein